ncbi:LON peptidase substrate-binding domain-containing protein [Gammaproteobacteria bacterium]|nr:LON peptidase substrate-binding domain-containing protein [Gammaproteobacteria bacterium]MDA7851726.1 LON peptidase substrate-binding domain-containing protein [Gammaproteobacteria bacterium]MDA8924938.1 LON peptidase substrate-binding domain-containing protein [Gammaproteobacteria bacterium]MDA9048832.1 LON peptidase substrate-binding domain-containing protein [Gammaproteobacteria bacterium]MDA9154462.1 LON peptidase substrate-binding domain-containing protein [Gammaproteobacteria bacterium
MNSLKTNKLPIFPIGIVVLPGTIQSLQIFEPRYLAMVKKCMNTDSGFVITLSNHNDKGESFLSQGTYVEIIDFNQLPNGLLGITVQGSQKVSIKSVEQDESGLHYGTILPITPPAVDDQAVLAQFPDLIRVLTQLKEHPSIKSLPLDIDLLSAESVSNHLAGLIPLSAEQKQNVLEAFDATQRMNILEKLVNKLSESST